MKKEIIRRGGPTQKQKQSQKVIVNINNPKQNRRRRKVNTQGKSNPSPPQIITQFVPQYLPQYHSPSIDLTPFNDMRNQISLLNKNFEVSRIPIANND